MYVYISISIYLSIYLSIYIYILVYTNLPVNAIVRLPHHRSGDSQGLETFLYIFLSGFSFTNIHDSQDTGEGGGYLLNSLYATSIRFTDA